jgi:alpha-beta hydrolase superfamily lysophospholipase
LSVGEAGIICQRESHACITQDGWRLHISHVFDPTAEAADTPRPQHPVLMVPGLASSGEHTFDLLPDYSLVNALVARGYDVWVPDLRGKLCCSSCSR